MKRFGVVPESRLRWWSPDRPREGEYVLYWMTAARRTRYNYGLEYALLQARELGLPLVVFEPLRCDYRWASDRFHRFVMQGMVDQAEALASIRGVTYFPFVEREIGHGKGLLRALARRAALVVADASPVFFLKRMVEAVAPKLGRAVVAVDSHGLLPLNEAPKVFTVAHAFRRHVQRSAPRALREFPLADPLLELELDAPSVDLSDLGWVGLPPDAEDLSGLPIDHEVPVVERRGGQRAARQRLAGFMQRGLQRYGEDRNHPDRDGQSHLSGYLHFGHLSTHEVLQALFDRESAPVLGKVDGKRHGFWGLSEAAESFVDELVTWREVGATFCWLRDDYDQFDSLPSWALQTIDEHREDHREVTYDLDALERGATHDPIWNAAQRQLVQTGEMHNYLRMLWGKLVYAWSPTPEEALERLIHLNNKYAIDGRDPNSYSGIFWCFGRFDRAWGPERLVFGKLRYMTSDSTRRKLKLSAYLEQFGPSTAPRLL